MKSPSLVDLSPYLTKSLDCDILWIRSRLSKCSSTSTRKFILKFIIAYYQLHYDYLPSGLEEIHGLLVVNGWSLDDEFNTRLSDVTAANE